MNAFRTAAFRALAFGLALPLAALLGAVGCDVDSTDSTASTIADNEGNVYNYSGLYMNTEEGSTNGYGALVFPAGRQSGATLVWLRLLQYGSVLEGYDSAGLTWSGSLSAQNGNVANFSLQGRTTAGQPVDVAGTLSYADQESTMDASWIEPGFAGSIFGKATVSPVATNSPIVTNSTQVTIDPDSWNFSANGQTKGFTADGGNGTYTWSCTATNVSLSATSGKSITVTRTSAGNGVLSASSSSSTPGTAQITCP